MTRAALLISNPGEPGAENYCKGVYVDVENYRRLLRSPEGGAWEEKEITILDRPTVATVRLHLALLSFTDYVFLMFTGHGWYSAPDRDRILQLRAGQDIASLELKKSARRRTIILDCCQEVHAESLKESRSVEFSAKSAAQIRQANRATCRRLFDQALLSAPMGILEMNSCSITELSTDDDDRGAHYNGSLIECVDDWSLSQAKNFYGGNSVLSCPVAHECAAQKTRDLSGGLQNPTIEKPRTAPYFPIAVFG
jgi:hypothetical protein